jgi:undecaprenyl-diphosphatase
VAFTLFALAALAGYLATAWVYDATWLVDADGEVADAMRDAPGWAVDLASVSSALGEHAVLPLVAAVAFAALLATGRRHDALFLVVVALGADLLVHAGRHAYEPVRAVAATEMSRFPSGHTATAVAIWGALALILARGRPTMQRVLVVAAGLTLGIGTGASRLVLDEAGASEVVAGVLLGLAWLALCTAAFELLHGRRVAPTAVVALLGGAVFALLALTYDEAFVGDLDEEVARWVATHVPAWLEWLARPFSWAGGWIGLVASGIAVGVVLARERAWIDLAFLVTAFAGSQLLANGLKPVFDRPRPSFGTAVSLPDSASFPSGHAAAAVACVGALAVLLGERLASERERSAVWAGALLLGAGIGLSRVVLGVHWVSDVVAGWALGAAWLALCLLGREVVRHGGLASPRG